MQKRILKIPKITQKIVLGSSSIYRQELLRRLQIPFETANPQADESALLNELPEKTAQRLAEAKARSVAKTYSKALIIGSDQVAVLDGIRLGKPLTHANAVKQLQLIRGREVTFFTALCLLNSYTDQLQTQMVPYHVKFRQLSDQQIENYLAKEQPYHCAGSAKSEGLGIALIERMQGDDPNALIGLPLIALIEMFENEGVEVV
ncbi:septum formation protein [Nitrosomonas aestuarii]|uniref:7-methyl-GTP pyrophosphatase n=1 Tax=Nitrosomonas aestuarii TaxID=52441 RepID=A0A1I4FVZ4_9PROT|nr:Maf family nucleotide pyrophosphatase [Nitrosomonas aestuarii]SFL21360.1 septum formation protein [Nitrosomonas aestuarii]